MAFHVPENYRVRRGQLASHPLDGNNGFFYLRDSPFGIGFEAIASDGAGWEHVSVKAVNARGDTGIPLWEEMCWIKDQFWDGEDVVIQFHPRKSEYVNNHPHVLHLWRPTSSIVPMPPHELVGVLVAPILA